MLSNDRYTSGVLLSERTAQDIHPSSQWYDIVTLSIVRLDGELAHHSQRLASKGLKRSA